MVLDTFSSKKLELTYKYKTEILIDFGFFIYNWNYFFIFDLQILHNEDKSATNRNWWYW